jgi:hypothetical protein
MTRVNIGAGLTPAPKGPTGNPVVLAAGLFRQGRPAILRIALLLLATGALTGCYRAYYQDIAASQYFPDSAYGQGRAAFKTKPDAYAPAPPPLALRPVFTPGP